VNCLDIKQHERSAFVGACFKKDGFNGGYINTFVVCVCRGFLANFFDAADNARVSANALPWTKLVKHFFRLGSGVFVAAATPHHHHHKSYDEDRRKNPCFRTWGGREKFKHY